MDASPQSSLTKSIGAKGAPHFIDYTYEPKTGEFYMIAFSATSTINHLYEGNGIDITGKSFPAGYSIGGQHTVIALNTGSAILYGNLG